MIDRTSAVTYARNVTPVISGYDAGAYGLPKAILESRAKESELPRLKASVSDALPEAEQDLAGRAEAVFQEVLVSRELPADLGKGWDALEARIRRLTDLQRRLQNKPADEQRQHTAALIAQSADQIIAKHLQPALAEVMAALHKLAPHLKGHQLTAEGMLRASGEARQAYLDAEAIGRRQELMRRAHLALLKPREEFQPAETYKNCEQLWGDRWRTRFVNLTGRQHLPWPQEPIAYMVWLATSGAELWVPTKAEYNAEVARLIAEAGQANSPEMERIAAQHNKADYPPMRESVEV